MACKGVGFVGRLPVVKVKDKIGGRVVEPLGFYTHQRFRKAFGAIIFAAGNIESKVGKSWHTTAEDCKLARGCDDSVECGKQTCSVGREESTGYGRLGSSRRRGTRRGQVSLVE